MEFYVERYKNVEKLEFECEIITPMFLSGANQSECELRPASIKGALRFWWRALYGINYSDIGKLKEAELDLFGSTDKKSKLKIQILQNPQFNKNNNYKPLPHKEKPNFSLPCFLPDNNIFKISLTCYENTKDIFENLFILFSIVGGLGRRARRGFGAFIINKKGNENFTIIINEKDDKSSPIQEKLIKAIFNCLEKINPNKFQINNNQIELVNNNINLNYPYVKCIKVGKESNNYNDLLKKIGATSHNNNCDYTGYAGKRSVSNSIQKVTKRFASPLYISCYKYNVAYFPIITQLNVAFDPNVTDINLSNDKTADFINYLCT
ncbi:MAG: type III-B CRISPR module RAMP protein Cmr1 [Brevinematia bacterium]